MNKIQREREREAEQQRFTEGAAGAMATRCEENEIGDGERCRKRSEVNGGFFMVRFSPHDLFVNMTSDLGAFLSFAEVLNDEFIRIFFCASSFNSESNSFCFSVIWQV